MEIDSKFNSIGPIQGPGDIESSKDPRVEEGPPRAFEVPIETSPGGLEAPVTDPLQAKLTEIVQGADLGDAQAASATERRVLQEILHSVFDDSFLQSLDMNDVLETFQGYIHDDPALKEIMDRFMQDLANPLRP